MDHAIAAKWTLSPIFAPREFAYPSRPTSFFADTDKRSNKKLGRPLWRWARITGRWVNLRVRLPFGGCRIFGKQSEGELRLLHFNPTARFHIRAFGRNHARGVAGVRCREDFSSSTYAISPLAGPVSRLALY